MELPGLSDAIIQARQHLENTAQDVKHDLAMAADGISSTITTTVSATTARAVQSLDYTVAQAEGVTNGIAHELWRIMVTDIEQWLGHHPVLSWLLAHPLVTISFGLASVVLVGGLIQAMAQLAQRGWTALLNVPLYLIRLGLRGLGQLIRWTVAQSRTWYRRSNSSPTLERTALSQHRSSGTPPAHDEAALPDSHFDSHPLFLRDEVATHSLDTVPLVDLQHALQHQSQATGDRQLLEVLKRLEYLGQEQTLALQHLIHLVEQRASVSQETRD